MKYLFFLMFILFSLPSAFAQKMHKEAIQARIAEMVASETFTFRAEMVYPQGRPSRYIHELYYLFTIKEKNVTCDLPYFGEAHTASLANDGGIKFNSKDYVYTKKETKKGWTISIKPKDNTDIKECIFNIYDNASANLVVVSNSRSTITYDGRILEPGSNN